MAVMETKFRRVVTQVSWGVAVFGEVVTAGSSTGMVMVLFTRWLEDGGVSAML